MYLCRNQGLPEERASIVPAKQVFGRVRGLCRRASQQDRRQSPPLPPSARSSQPFRVPHSPRRHLLPSQPRLQSPRPRASLKPRPRWTRPRRHRMQRSRRPMPRRPPSMPTMPRSRLPRPHLPRQRRRRRKPMPRSTMPRRRPQRMPRRPTRKRRRPRRHRRRRRPMPPPRTRPCGMPSLP